MIGNVYRQIAKSALEAQRLGKKEIERLLATNDFVKIDEVAQADDYIGEAVRSLRASLKEMSIVLPHGFTDYVKLGGMFDKATLTEETIALKTKVKADVSLRALMAMYDRTQRRAGNENPWRSAEFKDVWVYQMYLEPILEDLKMTVSADLMLAAWEDYWAD